MELRVDISPGISSVQGYAEDANRNMQSVYGKVLDYSPDSLELIDGVLQEWKDGGAPLNVITKSLYAFGSYAGEVMCRQKGFAWRDPFDEEVPQGMRGVMSSAQLMIPDNMMDEVFKTLPFLVIADDEKILWRPINLVFMKMLRGDGVNIYKSYMYAIQ